MKNINKENSWEIHENPEQTVEIVGSLEGALNSKNVDEVQKILQDPENLRSLIERRGEKDSSHDLLEKGFNALFQEKFGPIDIYHCQGSEVIDFIHEYNLPEQILIEYLGVAYHRRDKALLNRLKTIIFENEDQLENKSIVAAVLHNIASWKSSIDGNTAESLDFNKQALDAANKAKDLVLVEKIKYGFTYNKDLKPKDKAIGFSDIAERMEALDHKYDAMKARVDEALAHIELAKRQKNAKQSSERKDNLDIALELIKAAYNYATFKEISNLEVMALDAFSKVYEEMGDKEKTKRNQHRADLAREKYSYLTKRT